MTLLDDLEEARNKAWKEGFEIIEISLKTETHEKLKKEVDKMMYFPNFHNIKTVFGIPITIDNTIPSNKLWIMKKKKMKIYPCGSVGNPNVLTITPVSEEELKNHAQKGHVNCRCKTEKVKK